MKSTFKQGLIAFLAAVFLAAAIGAVVPLTAAPVSALADTGTITCANASGNYLNEDYLTVYKVPTSMMTYASDGGEANGAPLSNAFDGRWNTYWQTATENNGQQNANPTFLNAITVTFSQAVTIESIAYASSSARDGHGYPTTLNLYTANGGELSLYGTCNSTPTNNRVVFTLSEAVTVTQVKFEFRVVNTWHNWTATAKEIQFLQPDNASANKALDLFDDYAQLSVKEEYKSQLSTIRNDVKDLISYESALKPLLDRAEATLNGHLYKDSRREFSTDPNAENVINQYGNLRGYAGNTLKMSQFGIDRQVLGVGALRGQTVTIYVEASAGDPLPSVAFNQIYGHWSRWQDNYSLSLGKNVFTFPDFITSEYSVSTTPGGAIHIVNPYEPSQQSSNVKIYVEGGFLYPVFRKGGDIDSYRTQLTSYYQEMQATEGMCDITEIVGDHFMHTLSASVAYNDYVTGTANAQKNAEDWDNYIRTLLEFDGITFDPNNEHYNEKNLHLYANFRMTQPWAGAFAFSAGDHIGLIYVNQSMMTRYSYQGWGIAHEIGHALDVNGRTMGENTNNMWSKFSQAYFVHDVSRNYNASMTNVLTPDETAVSSHYFGIGDNWYCYQLWWNLEACHHGFWGELDNTYRYYDEAAAKTAAGVTAADGQLSADERIVYYSSLVMGEDLGYYYERFGFSFSVKGTYEPFTVENSSAAYKKLMQKAKDDGKIEEKGYKYWYVDANQYFFDMTGNGCYSSSESVEIVGANKTSAGYVLYLPQPEDANAHLGYEIMEYRNGNWYVIGFTYARSFTDAKAYPDGYVPQYKIRAYDRKLNCTAESAAKSFNDVKQTNVCRIGDTYYGSLSEAVAAASAGDTIYICKDLFDVAMTINKNLTILPDASIAESVRITKSAAGALITVDGRATLTMGSNDGAKIIIDGSSFSQNGTLIKVNSSYLNLYNAELCNNYNTDHGGAVYNTGVATFTNVTFKDNVTSINGGAIANFSGGVMTLTDCTVSGNRANSNGGAITIDGRTSLINTVVTGNHAGNVGGAMFISPAKNPDSRYVSVAGGRISDNTVGGNGSAFHIDKGIFEFEDAAVQISGGIYKNSGTTIRINTVTLDLSDVTFQSATTAEGTVLLTAKGITFTEEFVSGINVMASKAYLSDNGSTVLIRPNTATVTININGNTVTQVVVLGDFVLPETAEDIGEEKYISAWTSNGNSYAAGETVRITGDCTFTAEIGNKAIVTLKYDDDNIETYYVIPGTKFYLPIDSQSEQYKIKGWNVGDTTYAPAVGVTVTANTEIVADTVKLYKITMNGNDEPSVSWHEYSNSFVLESCSAPSGKKFSHWSVNGVNYKAGETVLVTSDMVITPVFSDIGNKPNGGVIAAIIIVVLVVLGGGAVAVVFVLKRKKTVKETAGNTAKKSTKSAPKSAEKPAVKTTAQSAAKPTPKATAQPEPKPATAKVTAKSAAAKPAPKATVQPAPKATAQPAPKATGTTSTSKPTVINAAKPTTSTTKPTTKPVTKPTTKPTTKK